LQPVVGILIRQAVDRLREDLGNPPDFRVVELGAGRAEMADAFAGLDYTPVDWTGGALPSSMTGVVFANEFFDALPVKVFRWNGGTFRELLVASDGHRFAWSEGDAPDSACAHYLAAYTEPREDGSLVEVNLLALEWIDRIGRSLDGGYLLALDYGYTRREMIRFPRGTLLAYRRHTVIDDVLSAPGAVDITAHVNFTALMEHASGAGCKLIRFESMARTLLRAGEPDQFAAALAAANPAEEARRRLQLKSLLFGMGETFRTLLVKGDPK
jgi:SAM-dependent MidA family methyltransferase